MRVSDLPIPRLSWLRKPLQPFTHPLQSWNTLTSLWRAARRAAPDRRGNTLRLFFRGLHLVRAEGFEPEEAFSLGLLDPAGDPQAYEAYVSKSRTMALQQELNPSSWARLLRSKGLFYRYCRALDLPTPTLQAIFSADRPGWVRTDDLLTTSAEWARFLTSGFTGDFVVKPATGYHGEGVSVYRREHHDSFVDSLGNRLAPAELVRRWTEESREQGQLIIQERLRNHPDLARLSASEYLQTVRVTTLVGGDSSCRVLQAVLKIIVGDNVTDNYRGGRADNLFGEVRLSDGQIMNMLQGDRHGGGTREVAAHPATGVVFREACVPMWGQVLSLVERAAKSFLPIRTVGWDIAVTPQGPRLVEGNVWWELPPLPESAEVIRPLVAAVRDSAGSVGPEETGESRRA